MSYFHYHFKQFHNATRRIRPPYRQLGKVSSFLLIALMVSKCTHAPTTQTQTSEATGRIALFFQTSREGVIDPCGCHSSPIGGMDREWNARQQVLQSKAAPLYADAGNLFVPSEMKKLKVDYYAKRAPSIVEMLNILELDVFSPGPNDWKMGYDTLKRLKEKAHFAFVTTNVEKSDGSPAFDRTAIVDRGGWKFGFVSITPLKAKVGKGLKVIEPVTALKKHLSSLKGAVDFIVVLSQLGENAKDLALLKAFPELKIMIAGDPKVTQKEATRTQEDQLLLDGHLFGYYVGHLDLQPVRPLRGFYSPTAIELNVQTLETYKKVRARTTDARRLKGLNDNIAHIEKNFQLAPIEGGTRYQFELISLDEKRFGATNAIAELIRKEKARTKAEEAGL